LKTKNNKKPHDRCGFLVLIPARRRDFLFSLNMPPEWSCFKRALFFIKARNDIGDKVK
jgi:hypothetical protein